MNDSPDDNLLQVATQHIESITEKHTHDGACVWLIALSGGCDSCVVLDLCTRHASQHAITIITVHVNHGQRPNSGDDAAFCEALTSDNPHVARHHTVALEVQQRGRTQEAARQLRWQHLIELAITHDACAIITGHHLDDAIETLLMNAARGAGSHGLSTLSRVEVPAPLNLCDNLHEQLVAPSCHRPLISSTRAEIEIYARARGINWVNDPTNATDVYTRNTIRHHVLPHLTRIQGGAAGWQRTLSILAEEAAFIDAQVNTLWRDHVCVDTPWEGAMSVSCEALVASPRLLVTRLFLLAHRHVSPAHATPGEAHLDALHALLRCDDSRPTSVALPGARVEREGDALVMMHAPERGSRGWFDARPRPIQLMIQAQTRGVIDWPTGELVWTRHKERPDEVTQEDAKGCWVRVDDVARVWCRGMLPGDRIMMEGRGERALKEELRAMKVPAWRRHLWPCIVLEDHEGAQQLAAYLNMPRHMHRDERAASMQAAWIWIREA